MAASSSKKSKIENLPYYGNGETPQNLPYTGGTATPTNLPYYGNNAAPVNLPGYGEPQTNKQASPITADKYNAPKSQSAYGGGAHISPEKGSQEAYERAQMLRTNQPGDPISDAAYNQAIYALNSVQSNFPKYKGTYDGQLADLYQKITNRGPFNYDLNADMLYQQYRDQYTDLGKLAMEDTMGQAAGLTGGYGSTYGQAVGQQQYEQYLDRLNDVIPDLYDRAYNRWLNEGDQLTQQYSILGNLADRDYDRYNDEYNKAFTLWAAQQDQANADRNFAFQKEQADREYQLALDKQFGTSGSLAGSGALGVGNGANGTVPQGSQSTSGISGGGGGGGGYDPSTAAIQQQLNAMGAGLAVDGVWGPKTQAAYERYMGVGAGLGSNLKTYSEAVAYQTGNGVDPGTASSIRTREEWSRMKANEKSGAAVPFEISNYATYQDYINDVAMKNIYEIHPELFS